MTWVTLHLVSHELHGQKEAQKIAENRQQKSLFPSKIRTALIFPKLSVSTHKKGTCQEKKHPIPRKLFLFSLLQATNVHKQCRFFVTLLRQSSVRHAPIRIKVMP